MTQPPALTEGALARYVGNENRKLKGKLVQVLTPLPEEGDMTSSQVEVQQWLETKGRFAAESLHVKTEALQPLPPVDPRNNELVGRHAIYKGGENQWLWGVAVFVKNEVLDDHGWPTGKLMVVPWDEVRGWCDMDDEWEASPDQLELIHDE